MKHCRMLSLLLALVLLVLGGCTPEPKTIRYGDRELTVAEEVPVNGYDTAAFSTVDGVTTYESETARSGIDVSSYQQEIDWQAVREAGVDFAIIRAGFRGYGDEGALNEDSLFRANMDGALEAGLDVGVYFFSQAVTTAEAVQEAGFLLMLLEPYADRLSYPVIFDWEYVPDPTARTAAVPPTALTDLAEAFCKVIKAAGYTPGVYFNRDQGYLAYDIARISQYELWLAELEEVPDFYYHFQLWQYSHTGTVAGIEGPVDRNISFKDYGAEE